MSTTKENVVAGINIIELLKNRFPNEVKEFEHAPWNFHTFGPCGIEEPFILIVCLQVGMASCIAQFIFDITSESEAPSNRI